MSKNVHVLFLHFHGLLHLLHHQPFQFVPSLHHSHMFFISTCSLLLSIVLLELHCVFIVILFVLFSYIIFFPSLHDRILNESCLHYYKMWVQFISPHSLGQWIHCFFTGPSCFHCYKMWVQFVSPHSLGHWIQCFFTGPSCFHYYKMWVQFISPHSLSQWIHCFFASPSSLQPVNSLKIQWNHLTYKDTFCCSVCWWWFESFFFFFFIFQCFFGQVIKTFIL
jgi:hypothetical protein